MSKPRPVASALDKAPQMMSFGFELAQEVAKHLASPRSTGVRDQLQRIAQVIARLSGVQGVLLVALDEEELPLTSGSDSLCLCHGGSDLEGLSELCQTLGPKLRKSRWITIDSIAFTGTATSHCLALPLHASGGAGASGLLLICVPLSERVPKTVLRILRVSSLILAGAIQSAIRSEAWNRIEALQRLAQETFNTNEQSDWDLLSLVSRLAGYFKADAVTMLLKDQQELRLVASTDPQLGQRRPVIYRAGAGLTGYVLQAGRGLRLSSTDDKVEIQRITGLANRTGPLHPEYDRKGLLTGPFMAVPMRFGGKVVGVVRMSRRERIARFTREDENAFQFFADLLGAALAPSWDLLLERSVLESATEAIAVTRREAPSVHRIIIANPGAERLLGRTKEELERMEAKEIYEPSEYERVHTLLRESLAERRKACGPLQTKMLRSDGTLIPITISYRFLANTLVQPPTLYTIGLARDISEADRLATQHQRLLESFESLGIAYFRAGRGSETLESTDLDVKITGYSHEELKRMSRRGLYSDLKHRDRLFEKARRNQGQVSREVVQMRRKDGTLFWAEGDLRILTSGDAEVGYEGFYRDVTERIRLQGFLNEDTQRLLSEDELFALLKQEAEFHLDYLSSLGHQLQTPLSSLIQTLRNLERGVALQRAITDRLPYVIGQAVVCTRLVRNLSYMDKILRGEPFHREDVSLAKLSIETKLDFIHLLKEKRLDLIVDDGSLKRILRVQGHRELLRQVMVNLVDNAIKYSVPESSINISARYWPDGPSLEITNVGLPVPEQEREKIFQRGHRTKKAKAWIPHGTGLGLWLVRKIVEAHDATIRFHEIDEGDRKKNLFRICFPQSTASVRT